MSVVIVWPGGEHTFALGLGELEALQQLTGEGPGASLNRLYSSLAQTSEMLGPWKIQDVYDTLRLGLIGGKMDGTEARKTVKTAVDRFGIASLIPAATDVLLDALTVRKDDQPKKDLGSPTPDGNGISASS